LRRVNGKIVEDRKDGYPQDEDFDLKLVAFVSF